MTVHIRKGAAVAGTIGLLVVVAVLLLVTGVFSPGGKHVTFSGVGSQAGKTSEQTFVDVVHKEFPDLGATVDASYIQLGHTICDRFEAGDSYSTLLLNGSDTDTTFTVYQIGYIIGAAAGTLCPQYAWEVPAS